MDHITSLFSNVLKTLQHKPITDSHRAVHPLHTEENATKNNSDSLKNVSESRIPILPTSTSKEAAGAINNTNTESSVTNSRLHAAELVDAEGASLVPNKVHMISQAESFTELNSHIERLEQDIIDLRILTDSKIEHLSVELAIEKRRNLRLNSKISTMKKELACVILSNVKLRNDVVHMIEEIMLTKRNNALIERRINETEGISTTFSHRDYYLLGCVGLVVTMNLGMVLNLKRKK